MDRGAWRATVHGVAKSREGAWHTHTHRARDGCIQEGIKQSLLTLQGVPGSWVQVGLAGLGGIPGAAVRHLLPEAGFPHLLCPLDSSQQEELPRDHVTAD